ncbi:MAG: NEAT domain-containing protein [Hespellia sp.]|nr:NEAT domain-containing protein [Hespellia sp.]
MNIKKRAVHVVLTILAMCSVMMFGQQTVHAADTQLADADYVVNLREVGDNGTVEKYFNKINCFPRALLMARKGKYTLTLTLHGYDQWSTIQLFDQSANKEGQTIKAGTDWEMYKGKTGEGYSALSEKEGDVSMNEHWSQIPNMSTYDTKTNTGMITFELSNINDVFTIGGYAETTYNEKLYNYLAVQNYKLDLNSIKNASGLMYLAYGWDMGVAFQIETERTISKTSNIQYDNLKASSGLFRADYIESTTCAGNNGILTAKFKVKEDAAEKITGVQLIETTSLSEALKRPQNFYYQGYLMGTGGTIYGDNIYDADKREFKIDFTADGTTLSSLYAGVDVKITTEENPDGYRAVIYLSEDGMKSDTYRDDATDTSYTTYAKYVEPGAVFSVKSGEEADEYQVKTIKGVADGDKWVAYTFNFKDEAGNDSVPRKGGCLRVPIPDDWDMNNIYVSYGRGQNGHIDSNSGSAFTDTTSFVEEGGKRYLEYWTGYDFVNGSTVAMCQVLKEADLSSIKEDGLYEATAKFIKADTDTTMSMANGALDEKVYIRVKDGKKSVYMTFHPIVMNEADGWYAYLGTIYNKSESDCEIYNYEINEDGSLMDNAGFDALTEFACLKAVKIDLSDDTITENSYKIKVIPPAMGADLPYDKVLSDPIDADLKFYNVNKVKDESSVQIPTYQKAVLRKSIDKAGRYNESSYSAETWATLKEAMESGQEFYNSLDGTDAGTNASSSKEIREKSQAIEAAIKDLKENDALSEAREELKTVIDKAKEVQLGNKTVSAFNELQSSIGTAEAAYNRSNVTIDELKNQKSALEDAIETFNNSADASALDPSHLEDGTYKVYADMKKVDKTTNSMANNAIEHWVELEVKDGVYTAQLDFCGMTISGKFGYLQNLSYYGKGYSYDGNGEPSGTLNAATVLTTQKNTDGSDIIDNFNNADSLYPDKVSIPLVDGGLKSEGNAQYVPLQVYVPIMESITAGTGTQNVLMKIDWTSLKSAEDDSQEVINFEDDGVYTVTSSIREVGTDDTSDYNKYLKKVRFIAENNQLKIYLDLQSAAETEIEKYITGIDVLDAKGNSIEINSTTETESGKIIRAEFVLPSNVELTQIKLTDNNETTFDGRLYLALRSASGQTVDKTTLEKYISNAKEILADGKNYAQENIDSLKEALTDAEEVNEDPVSIGEEISAAGLNLKNAIAAMEEIKPIVTDKTALKALIEKAEKISNKDETYTDDSFANLQKTIKDAVDLFNNDDATQDQVDAQVTSLQTSIDALAKKDSDTAQKEDLALALADAEKLDSSKYTEESWQALKNTYDAAADTFNNEKSSQAEVDTHTKALRAAINALIEVQTGKLADGLYEINAEIVNATDPSKLSMADGSLEKDENGNKKPLYVEVKNGKAILRMRFSSLTIDFGDAQHTGYLGELKYLTYEDTDTVPTDSENTYDASIESSYQGYDEYNDPDFGTDQYMKGKSYPEQATIPVELGDTEIWLKVYVPIMESLTKGSGSQYARLRLDWSDGSLKQVRDDRINIEDLAKQIEYAKAIEKQDASDKTWNALQQAIVSAQAVYDSFSATQEQVDAQIDYLQKAMAAVQAENDQKSDKTKLQAAIALANEKLQDTSGYTPESVQILQDVLTAAQKAYEDKEATQATVDAMTNALTTATNGLKSIAIVDVSALQKKIEKAETYVSQTDKYTAESLRVLQISINNAKRIIESADKTQQTVDQKVNELENAIKALVQKPNVDKSGLQSKIDDAKEYLENESTYTASSIATLKTALINAQSVLLDENVLQAGVDAQVKALENAIKNLEKVSGEIQDITKLKDGIYAITGNMVKIDKSTASMADGAINHTIKLTVKDGKYYVSLDFVGLKISGKYGYLSTLKYFESGYSLDKYGAPTGSAKNVTIDSYQLNGDGSKVSDNFGTDYPNHVTFPMINEALKDGYVPLQVFVPIMESISAGTGTQPVFLKLDWSTIKATTSDDNKFEDNKNNNTGGDNSGTSDNGGNSLLNGNNTLSSGTTGQTSTGSTLSSGSTGLSTGSSSLKSGSTGLSSGSSALKSGTTSLSSGKDSLTGSTGLSSSLSSGTKLGNSTSTGSKAKTTTKAADDTNTSAAAVPLVMSLLAVIAGVLYKLKSRGLLKFSR